MCFYYAKIRLEKWFALTLRLLRHYRKLTAKNNTKVGNLPELFSPKRMSEKPEKTDEKTVTIRGIKSPKSVRIKGY